MLMKETTRNRTKIFHICDPYDIATIRALREQEETSSKSKKQANFEEEEGDESNPLQNLLKTQVNHALPGSLQVVNFHRTNLSYEFASKYMQDNNYVAKAKKAAVMDPREQ